MNGGAVGVTYLKIAAAKAALPAWRAFFLGVLCNILVCTAVWMALAGRSVIDKFVTILLPISAFVAAGFEHSIANMYFFPLVMLLKWHRLALPPGAVPLPPVPVPLPEPVVGTRGRHPGSRDDDHRSVLLASRAPSRSRAHHPD